ncbi:methionine sulfoxide reductase A [Rhizobium sp. Leaf384]|uniref:peptide-methionine (S)-S-oxide reductase MsrA n=1 Tax=unclassified Rhizobium TaxID=2613769 RepID=UPI00071574C7|nr:MULTISPECIES: peptide-methionine (S)-S-oxide reductase MsrA [unclassified Rhizobium]KQR69032.1 methionine sulfoxide reductase A [Rhizobium sp. Leaf341]KQS79446.1 methionine sulfoxide reductase A [Rhizobium sp. Leaf384]KQS85087.1 methionine sulfoxide reductase A [Rhizobium sp. Leaf383]
MLKTSRSNLRRNLTGGVLGAFALTALIIAVTAVRAGAAEEAVVIPPPSIDVKTSAKTEKAVFAGGCFWGVQGVFQHVKGVTNAVSGYSGGAKDTASYETVSGGKTGHAEAVEVTFDPSQISYGQLLQVFFSVAHNPTQLNYQGPDHGTQYRSAIFTLSPEQKKVASAYVAQLDTAKVFPDKVVTEVDDLKGFYTAEAYHQDFLTLNPDYPYIVYNDLPKIENLKTVFPTVYRDKPALVSQAKG